MKNRYLPSLYIIIGLVVGMMAYHFIFRSPSTNDKFDRAKDKQDSLIIVRDTVIKEVVRYSNQNAAKGKELIKKLPNETIVIPDTTLNAKWEYLQSYSPNNVLP